LEGIAGLPAFSLSSLVAVVKPDEVARKVLPPTAPKFKSLKLQVLAEVGD